ncbi:hypothetical protein [Chitinimonas koreensis]|uniref:hypothetical protein n=1 Tax=Chitinimonas koreensis TaxID=356302 RepID=UPI000491A4A3|nr:hypothetical protein [Chitinimonas koreensis]QNM95531.1 hypothetical protein H9L41_16895 [Chitinimonas koreensis]
MSEFVELTVIPILPAVANRLALRSVPWKIALSLWMVCAMVLMIAYTLNGAFSFAAIAFFGLIHEALGWVYRIDPCLPSVLWRYYHQAACYDPWPHHQLRRNARPSGLGRGSLC